MQTEEQRRLTAIDLMMRAHPELDRPQVERIYERVAGRKPRHGIADRIKVAVINARSVARRYAARHPTLAPLTFQGVSVDRVGYVLAHVGIVLAAICYVEVAMRSAAMTTAATAQASIVEPTRLYDTDMPPADQGTVVTATDAAAQDPDH